ncbi:hypothetical protein J583_2153 [Acinetobacter baumannii 83444]|nr:hypothetical protein J583_2153 [Acinetobacter baumannii 83444]
MYFFNRDHVEVHGGIRHLEIDKNTFEVFQGVHGGIRHLEIELNKPAFDDIVHGGIRHLEIKPMASLKK